MNSLPDPQATLEAWRQEGADQHDPVRFHFLEALVRRTQAQQGAARRVLDARLASLIATYADSLSASPPRRTPAGALAATTVPPTAPPAVRPTAPRSPGPLAALVAHLAQSVHTVAASPTVPGLPTEDSRPGSAPRSPPTSEPKPERTPELKTVAEFRSTWARLSADRRLRQALAQPPGQAGPLNSRQLIHRTLALMQTLSPAYLHQFIGYVDALSWLERAGPSQRPTAPPPSSSRSSSRGDTRRQSARPRSAKPAR